MRAPDLGYAPRFLSFSLACAGFRFEGESTLPPQAGNARPLGAGRKSVELARRQRNMAPVLTHTPHRIMSCTSSQVLGRRGVCFHVRHIKARPQLRRYDVRCSPGPSRRIMLFTELFVSSAANASGKQVPRSLAREISCAQQCVQLTSGTLRVF